jgi:hypothetical protein
MWTRGVVVSVALTMVTACGEPASVTVEHGAGQTVERDDPGAAWTHLGMVETVLADGAAAAAIEDQDTFAAGWSNHGFEGVAPEVDFDHHAVLLLGQPDDACPDELIELEVVGDRLEVGWLPPAGGCEQPLIMRLHAIEVHRGHLPDTFRVELDPPFENELTSVTIELAAYDGHAAPPPREPPSAMSDDELEQVFAGHPVRRCRPEDRPGQDGEVDGPLSDDAAVAEAQRQRAGFGLTSDEATVRRLLDDPGPSDVYGFPVLDEELEEDMAAGNVMDELVTWLGAEGFDLQRDLTPILSRSGGIQPMVLVTADDEDRIRVMVDERFGPGIVEVRVQRWDPAEVADAQEAVTELMGHHDGSWQISWVSGPPGPAEIGVIDPTQEALDAIAELVDPDLVCVSVELSGVQPALLVP